jgi:hypothetical protein
MGPLRITAVKFRIALALLLALTIGCKPHAVVPPVVKVKPHVIAAANLEEQHATTFRVGVYELFPRNPKVAHGEAGHCSGTAVGPHTVLTAQHCFKDGNLIRVGNDEYPTHILAALVDGRDHVIYLTDRDFATWATIDQRSLVAKEPIHFWGAPGGNNDVYRTGYFRKMAPVEDVDKNFPFQNFILPTFPGDSGSGLFDANGSIVAVISMADESAGEYSLPLNFTDGQLDIATAE